MSELFFYGGFSLGHVIITTIIIHGVSLLFILTGRKGELLVFIHIWYKGGFREDALSIFMQTRTTCGHVLDRNGCQDGSEWLENDWYSLLHPLLQVMVAEDRLLSPV